MRALNTNFGFHSRVIKDHNYPTIFIPQSDLIKLQQLIRGIMHPTLLYKIHL